MFAWILLSCSVWEIKGSFFLICTPWPQTVIKLYFLCASAAALTPYTWPTRTSVPFLLTLDVTLGGLFWEARANLPHTAYIRWRMCFRPCPWRHQTFFHYSFWPSYTALGPKVITFFCWAGSSCFSCWFFIRHAQFQPARIFFINDDSCFFFLPETSVWVKKFLSPIRNWLLLHRKCIPLKREHVRKDCSEPWLCGILNMFLSCQLSRANPYVLVQMPECERCS